MSNIFFTSDTHFGHANIIKYSNRPFTSADYMDEVMITKWNDVVKQNDIVYHLGDVSFRNEQATKVILARLNGKINFLRGNHDRVMDKLYYIYGGVKDYAEIRMDNQKIVLCHYPLLTWNGAYKGSWMLHGHCHGSVNYMNNDTSRLDVGVDNFNYTPVSFEEIRQLMKDKNYTAVAKNVRHN